MVGMLQHPNILPIYTPVRKTALLHCHRATSCTAPHAGGVLPAPTTSCGSTTSWRSSTRRPRAAFTRTAAASFTATSSRAISCSRSRATCGSSISASRWCRLGHLAHRGHCRQPVVHVAEQVQSIELTNRSDLYSLGPVMYELLTGTRPFRAATCRAPASDRVRDSAADSYAAPGNPGGARNRHGHGAAEGSAKRYKTGLDFAAELTRVHQKLRAQYNKIDQQEQFSLLRKLKFFHEFSHGEIWEVLRASSWQITATPRRSSRKRDGRPVLHHRAGRCVERLGKALGYLDSGDCFGETSYLRGAKRTATIKAAGPVTVMKVSSTLSSRCRPNASCASIRSSCAT